MDVNESPMNPINGDRRVIKRYSNRKLYDTRQSRYVTLQHIGDMVRAGEDVQIIDNATKEDKTEVTLALILSEELKTRPRSIPLGTLRELIQEHRAKILSQLREGPIGRLIPGGELKEGGAVEESASAPAEVTEAEKATSEAAEKVERVEKIEKTEKVEKSEKVDGAKGLRFHDIVETSKATLDQWQHAIDERIRAVLPNFSAFHDLQSEVRKLTKKVEDLESRLRSRGGRDEERKE